MHKKMREYTQKILEHQLPRWKDLPDIELYMDQVIMLMQKYLGPYMLSEDLLTPSMINNYVKINALPAPEKKRYSREHLSRLLVICLTKRQLPIPVISVMIEERILANGIEASFDSFVSAYESTFKSVAQSVDTKQNLTLCAFSMAINAAASHTLAEAAVDILTDSPKADPKDKDIKKEKDVKKNKESNKNKSAKKDNEKKK